MKETYHSFTYLREATSTKVEIVFSTVEEIAFRVEEKENRREERRKAKYNDEWLDTPIYAILDTNPNHKKVTGKWVTREEFFTFCRRQFINPHYEVYKLPFYGSRRDYFAELNMRNK